MLPHLHLDGAFAQATEIPDAIGIDILAFDLPRPGDAFKAWRRCKCPVLHAAFRTRAPPRVACMMIVLRSRLGVCLLGDLRMTRAIGILPQYDQAVVVDARAALSFVDGRGCRIVAPQASGMRAILHGRKC
ncbi:hypothetical protein [Xanthomonas arboricola]|uniref:Uncharacterized protein n=3 Tax=Xanthomonas arboricola pv. pruni TaxID=69929 RepID=A0ACC6V732_9XANT|nr:hypothetical protein F6Y24_06365 [Xanthomonas arboricola pv. pruni]RST75746.1 hypothetical protein EJK96_00850 [Xanthomonas arboricola pv. pruni]RST80337.1 hypothetical protein EJL05_07520 [Xanthomonas arboricola pv. pruni]UQP94723.1 hypothetical protein KQR53_04030 [Xanthomonas arboricola pv. pruni]UQQ05799.1 hypothetical protein KP026_16715 [Xanthomonas arboricola pv. pruni]